MKTEIEILAQYSLDGVAAWHQIYVPEPYQAGPRQDGPYAIYPYDEQFLPTDRFIGDPGFRIKQRCFHGGVRTW